MTSHLICDVCTSCSVTFDSLWHYGLQPSSLLSPQNSPGKNTGVGCHFLLHYIWYIFQITNYDFELSSHSISNTRPAFSSGSGVRGWGLSMNHRCSQGPFRATQQHQVCPKELAHMQPARGVLFLHLTRNPDVRLCTRKFPCFWNFRLCTQFLTLKETIILG